MSTRDRVLTEATVAFASHGVAGTSLDALARELDLTKQTILYHFGSKDGLISAVLTKAAEDLVAELQQAVDISEPGWDRVVATVRASFALAVRRPELLGLLREVNRLGSAWSEVVLRLLQPLIDRALSDLSAGMADGRFQRGTRRWSWYRPTRLSPGWLPTSNCCGRSASSWISGWRPVSAGPCCRSSRQRFSVRTV